MCEKHGIDFIRLDFGNKLSGLKSDVDHTAHAAWKQLEAAIRAKRTEVTASQLATVGQFRRAG